MVKLERNKAIERAIQRAAQARNFVMRMDEGRYTVVSGKSNTASSLSKALTASLGLFATV